MRAFSRVQSAQEALDDYRESIKQQLAHANIAHHLTKSRDVQKTQNANADSHKQAL